MPLNLEKLLKDVCSLAREAGCFLREEQQRFRREAIVEKHSHDYVSYVDKESERMIVERLHTILPEAGFITEEGSASYQDEPYCWVVDPLDGTTNFIHGTMPYCVSIALRTKDELLLGVVYEPSLDECFSAIQGGGAFLNGRSLHVSGVTSLEQAFLITELPYNSTQYAATGLHLIHSLYGKVAGLRMNGSAALAICYVAAGRIDGWLEAFIGEWDFSAAALIVQEAGGRVTNFLGADYYLDGHHIIATNGHIHSSLQQLVMQVPPKDM